MKVLKFGGTSVGSVKNIIRVKNIINDGQQKIVVLSAMSGTTNQLVAIVEAIANKALQTAIEKINLLQAAYSQTINDLVVNDALHKDVKAYVSTVFDFLLNSTFKPFSKHVENSILAQGELLSTYIVNAYLNQEGIRASIIPALGFMRIDAAGEPNMPYIKTHFKRAFDTSEASNIYITQGFICLDENDTISNLQRGGSDYTATIIGACIKAEEVQIWTDIDGMHNNDPRYVAHNKTYFKYIV